MFDQSFNQKVRNCSDNACDISLAEYVHVSSSISSIVRLHSKSNKSFKFTTHSNVSK